MALIIHAMLPHRIRLRGPWTATPVGQTRHFSWPAKLDDHERVWLTIAGIRGHCTATLNGQAIGSWNGGAAEVEVTQLLKARNELRLESPAVVWDAVALEVRARTWLADLAARRDNDRLIVSGRVRGDDVGSLDLYAILDRRTAVAATVGVGTFEFSSESLSAIDSPVVGVELIQGSVVWHAAQVPIDGN